MLFKFLARSDINILFKHNFSNYYLGDDLHLVVF